MKLKAMLAGLALGLIAQPLTAQVWISEIMASGSTLKDEDGDSPDWIELWNTGAIPVNLAGWHLTDQPEKPTKWTFPGTNLACGEFLVVFASGKDRAVAGAPLHTNFKLSAAGEYLGLIEPDGVTIAHQYWPGYPLQAYGVSYGLTNVLVQSGQTAVAAGFPSGGASYAMNQAITGPNRSQMVAALQSLPCIFLATSMSNLFDPGSGIYANSEEHGPAWERPASIAWVDTNGQSGFEVSLTPGVVPSFSGISAGSGAVTLEFPAAAGYSYSLLWSPQLPGAGWSKLLNVPAGLTDQSMTYTSPVDGQASRFFRLVSPALP